MCVYGFVVLTMNGLRRIPKMGGKDLDVHLLYREVSSRGGLQAVSFLLLLPVL